MAAASPWRTLIPTARLVARYASSSARSVPSWDRTRSNRAPPATPTTRPRGLVSSFRYAVARALFGVTRIGDCVWAAALAAGAAARATAMAQHRVALRGTVQPETFTA